MHQSSSVLLSACVQLVPCTSHECTTVLCLCCLVSTMVQTGTKVYFASYVSTIVWYAWNIRSVWLKVIRTSIHVSLYTPRVSVMLWDAIFQWLSIRCVSSYKKVILSHILHSLSCLAYCILYFVKQICYFPSLPPFGSVVIVTVKLINVVHLSYLAIG